MIILNKSLRIILLLAVLLISSCGEEEAEETISENLLDLTGTWEGENYDCEDIKYTEDIRIRHDLSINQVIATKITGDPCVTAGSVTFTGDYDGVADWFRVVFTTGSPQNPSSGRGPGGVMEIRDANLMVVRHNPNFRFSRKE